MGISFAKFLFSPSVDHGFLSAFHIAYQNIDHRVLAHSRSNISLIDLSSNSLFRSIVNCLPNITGPVNLAFTRSAEWSYYSGNTFYGYGSILPNRDFSLHNTDSFNEKQEVDFVIKSGPISCKGGILDFTLGLDLSCNYLTGEIPIELGMLVLLH